MNQKVSCNVSFEVKMWKQAQMGLYDASSSTAWEENFICQWQFDKMHCNFLQCIVDRCKYNGCIWVWQIQIRLLHLTNTSCSNQIPPEQFCQWAFLKEVGNSVGIFFKKNCFVFCQEIHTYPGFEEYWYWSSSSLTF